MEAWALVVVETWRTPSLTVNAPLPVRARVAALLPERMSVERPVLVREPAPVSVPERVCALIVRPVAEGTTERVSMVRTPLPRLIAPVKVWLRVPYWPRRIEVTAGLTKIGLAIVGATLAVKADKAALPVM